MEYQCADMDWINLSSRLRNYLSKVGYLTSKFKPVDLVPEILCRIIIMDNLHPPLLINQKVVIPMSKLIL